MERVPDGGIHFRDATMSKDEITNRLKRVEGQVRGLQRMVDEGRECEAILTQLMADRAALDQVGLIVADNFVQECVLAADPHIARERAGRVLSMVFARFSVPSVEDDAVAEKALLLDQA